LALLEQNGISNVKGGDVVRTGSFNLKEIEVKASRINQSLVSNVNSNNTQKDYTGVGLATFGASLEGASYEMYNKNTWYSIYKMKSYKQTFNGNGYTGGKNAHGKFWSKGFDYAGKGLGLYQAGSILLDYSNDKINSSTFIAEEGSNIYSTFGGIYGAAWGIGWEGGRLISTTEWYHKKIFIPINPAGRDGLITTKK
jgi:hypothetical protein